ERKGIEVHRDLADLREIRPRAPRGIAERHAFRHQRRIATDADRDRRLCLDVATGDFVNTVGQPRLVARQVASAAPYDRSHRSKRQADDGDPGDPSPGNADGQVLAQSPEVEDSVENPNASTVRRK